MKSDSSSSEWVLRWPLLERWSPAQRHAGRDQPLLAARHALYTEARQLNPARWSGSPRDGFYIDTVTLNRVPPASLHDEHGQRAGLGPLRPVAGLHGGVPAGRLGAVAVLNVRTCHLPEPPVEGDYRGAA